MGGVAAARTAGVVLTAFAVLGGHMLRVGVPEPSEAVELDSIPYRIGDWRGRDIEVRPRVLEILRPDGFLLREYVAEGELPMQVYVDYHRVQRLGSTIHSPRICYPGTGWKPMKIDVATMGDGEDDAVCWLVLRSEDREMLTAYWYESRWGRSARETHLKMGIVRSAFARRPSDAALLRVATPLVGDDEEGARERIRRFVAAVAPALDRELPFGGAGS